MYCPNEIRSHDTTLNLRYRTSVPEPPVIIWLYLYVFFSGSGKALEIASDIVKVSCGSKFAVLQNSGGTLFKIKEQDTAKKGVPFSLDKIKLPPPAKDCENVAAARGGNEELEEEFRITRFSVSKDDVLMALLSNVNYVKSEFF